MKNRKMNGESHDKLIDDYTMIASVCVLPLNLSWSWLICIILPFMREEMWSKMAGESLNEIELLIKWAFNIEHYFFRWKM